MPKGLAAMSFTAGARQACQTKGKTSNHRWPRRGESLLRAGGVSTISLLL
jgi:hypothetical protein